jgi:hypothetical protein
MEATIMTTYKAVNDYYYGDFTLAIEEFDFLSIDSNGTYLSGNSEYWRSLVEQVCLEYRVQLRFYTQNGNIDWCHVVWDNAEICVHVLGECFS